MQLWHVLCFINVHAGAVIAAVTVASDSALTDERQQSGTDMLALCCVQAETYANLLRMHAAR